ncbi:uncharacterized protein LOC143064569 [Mytilus galloprovincialis]|uniref:uncharacterized protein LOC143064569 n=1 Tax=Mytilus galloprovincialis TaxID=29158 RepID=UPI003F7C199E
MAMTRLLFFIVVLVTTIGLTSTVSGTTPLTLCADIEDAKFNCKDYNNHYGLCTSLTPTLQTIARTRCPKFCNLCVNGTAPTQSTLTGTTTLPPCSDHDNRCSQASYKNLLCNPNAVPDTKKYAIETCPLTCNYCTEYYALLNHTMTTQSTAQGQVTTMGLRSTNAGFTPTLKTGPPCEDKIKINCTILVASNTCDVPIVKNLCAKSCNLCSQGTLLNVQPVG